MAKIRKKIQLFSALLVLHLISVGCASPSFRTYGTSPSVDYFERYVPNRGEIGSLTEAKVIETIGKPIEREERGRSDGKRISKLQYFYVDDTAENDGRSTLSVKTAQYVFIDGVFSYSISGSTFKDDSTRFNVERAILIGLGDSYSRVVELLGEPSGMGVGDDDFSYSAAYSYQLNTIPYVADSREIETLLVFFDDNDTVVNIGSPNGTVPTKVY